MSSPGLLVVGCTACLVLCTLTASCAAKSIIGYAAVGLVSHQLEVAQIGLELTKRGHSFAMLVSSDDSLTQSSLAKPPFREVRQVTYSGAAGLGTNAWRKSLPRAPQQVLPCSSLSELLLGKSRTDCVFSKSLCTHRGGKYVRAALAVQNTSA